MIFIRPDTFVHDERYAHGSAVTPSVVDDAMRAGNTLLVHNLEIYWKPVGEGPCELNCARLQPQLLVLILDCLQVSSANTCRPSQTYTPRSTCTSLLQALPALCAHTRMLRCGQAHAVISCSMQRS